MAQAEPSAVRSGYPPQEMTNVEGINVASEEQERCDLVESVKLQPGITFDAALSKLEKIKHQKFAKTLKKCWLKGPDGDVAFASKCWLFCWGWSGNSSSDPTAEYCSFLWNKLFDKEYRWFDANIGYEFAKAHRDEQVACT